MFFSTTIAALLGASAVMAGPVANKNNGSQLVCTGTPSTPECCAVGVLGLASLQCAPPPKVPKNVDDFTAICASIGQEAMCCTIPILGQGLICQAPDGTPLP